MIYVGWLFLALPPLELGSTITTPNSKTSGTLAIVENTRLTPGWAKHIFRQWMHVLIKHQSSWTSRKDNFQVSETYHHVVFMASVKLLTLNTPKNVMRGSVERVLALREWSGISWSEAPCWRGCPYWRCKHQLHGDWLWRSSFLTFLGLEGGLDSMGMRLRKCIWDEQAFQMEAVESSSLLAPIWYAELDSLKPRYPLVSKILR